MTIRWGLLTGEYPPQPGGVADYTALVARRLATAGDAVVVYAPHSPSETDTFNVTVVRLPDHFGPRGLAVLDRALARRPRPDRILVQYVPHAFGFKAMNLPFAAWVAARAGGVAPVWVMAHEVMFPFRWRPPAHALLAAVHRLMARLVFGAADRLFVSVPAWAPLIRRICPHAPRAEWLPIPSNVPHDPSAGRGPGLPPGHGPVVGHFGTYGPPVADLLAPILARLLAAPDRLGLLVGRGGPAFRDRLLAAAPALAGRVVAPGDLSPDDVAAHLRACDLLVQPFIDGISSRRTSAMAGLANGVPVVTSLGHNSEPMWRDAGGVALAVRPDPNDITAAAEAVLAAGPDRRAEMGRAAADLYRKCFSLDHTIARLRGT